MSAKKFTREEKSWITYDWANSVFATIMMAALFPIYFTEMAGEGGDIWWGYGSSAATLVMAILAPIAGALGDRKGNKKKVFMAFWILGMLGTAICAVVTEWKQLLIRTMRRSSSSARRSLRSVISDTSGNASFS